MPRYLRTSHVMHFLVHWPQNLRRANVLTETFDLDLTLTFDLDLWMALQPPQPPGWFYSPYTTYVCLCGLDQKSD